MTKFRNLMTVKESPIVAEFYDGLIQMRILSNTRLSTRYILVKTQDILDNNFQVAIIGQGYYNKPHGKLSYIGTPILEKCVLDEMFIRHM